LIALNQATGGARSGGNGLGGGIFIGGPTPVGTPSLTLRHSFVVFNQATGGASNGGSTRLGQGGGLYLTDVGIASADHLTILFANNASTSDDDVSGELGLLSQLESTRIGTAGGVLTAKQAPHRLGITPALGLRAGGAVAP
jgi:hypothetical protein